MGVVAVALFWIAVVLGIVVAIYGILEAELNKTAIFVPTFFLFAAAVAKYLAS